MGGLWRVEFSLRFEVIVWSVNGSPVTLHTVSIMTHISLEDYREYRMQECQIIVSCCLSFREKRCLLELKGMVSWCRENTVNLSPTLKKATLFWNSCVLFVGGIKHECLCWQHVCPTACFVFEKLYLKQFDGFWHFGSTLNVWRHILYSISWY
jgi:hypothetical protein